MSNWHNPSLCRNWHSSRNIKLEAFNCIKSKQSSKFPEYCFAIAAKVEIQSFLMPKIFNHILICALNLLSFQPSYKFRTLCFHPLIWLLLYKFPLQDMHHYKLVFPSGDTETLNSSNTKENWAGLPLTPLQNLSFRRADKAVSLFGTSNSNQGGPSCLEASKGTRRTRRSTWRWTEVGSGSRIALN